MGERATGMAWPPQRHKGTTWARVSRQIEAQDRDGTHLLATSILSSPMSPVK